MRTPPWSFRSEDITYVLAFALSQNVTHGAKRAWPRYRGYNMAGGPMCHSRLPRYAFYKEFWLAILHSRLWDPERCRLILPLELALELAAGGPLRTTNADDSRYGTGRIAAQPRNSRSLPGKYALVLDAQSVYRPGDAAVALLNMAWWYPE